MTTVDLTADLEGKRVVDPNVRRESSPTPPSGSCIELLQSADPRLDLPSHCFRHVCQCSPELVLYSWLLVSEIRVVVVRLYSFVTALHTLVSVCVSLSLPASRVLVCVPVCGVLFRYRWFFINYKSKNKKTKALPYLLLDVWSRLAPSKLAHLHTSQSRVEGAPSEFSSVVRRAPIN